MNGYLLASRLETLIVDESNNTVDAYNFEARQWSCVTQSVQDMHNKKNNLV